MKKIILLLIVILVGLQSKSNAQNQTLLLKPNAQIGQDAMVWWTAGQCQLYLPNSITAAENNNWGNDEELIMDYWTFNFALCNEGKRKFFIRFSQINQLPTNANIISATLKLYGGNQNNLKSYGQSYFPGSPYGITNPGILKRLLPGNSNNWNESTITWNNSLNFTYAPSSEWVTIPVTTSRFNYNLTLDVTTPVSEIHDDIVNGIISPNNGFVLQLDAYDTIYKGQIYLSSDHADSTLWPELEIVYTTNGTTPDTCDSSFTLTQDHKVPHRYTFSANQPNALYTWTVNGQTISNSKSGMHDFLYDQEVELCLKVTIPDIDLSCIHCTKINRSNSIHESELISDNISIQPNPTNEKWVISSTVNNGQSVKIQLRDITGKIIREDILDQSSIEVDAGSLSQGIYILEVHLGNKHNSYKLIKN